ncbi:MAG: hypothetical protein GX422_08195 [Deltaproteobacteria bacterium]|nr:hypothetical protein [Deltaproteobacteria bacterium]
MAKEAAKIIIDETGTVVAAEDMGGNPLKTEEGSSIIGAQVVTVWASESGTRAAGLRGCVWRLIGGVWKCVPY